MRVYVIRESPDGTSHSLSENGKNVVEGMSVVHTFAAQSWERAQQYYDGWMGRRALKMEGKL